MRRSARTFLSLLMLVFLLASMGARGFHSKEWVHDLDHHGHLGFSTLDYAHTGTPQAGGMPASEPFDEVEHLLLHAVGTLYVLASPIAIFSWDVSAQIVVPDSSFPGLPIMALETPFRPPRRSALL